MNPFRRVNSHPVIINEKQIKLVMRTRQGTGALGVQRPEQVQKA